MRKICVLLLLSLVVSLSINVFSQNDLRLMTYNVRNGKGMDLKTDYRRIADVVNRFHPDLVAVQELDSVTKRSNQKYVLKEIALLTGMQYNYAPAISYGGGKYGIGILSKEAPIRVSTKSLPGREEARMLQILEFKDYVFMNVHLSLTEEDQLSSVEIIREELAKINKPVFIGGDFNAHPNSKVIEGFKKSFKILSLTGNTFPADVPTECLDYILIDKKREKRVKLLNSFIVDEPMASDHRPVVVDITMQ